MAGKSADIKRAQKSSFFSLETQPRAFYSSHIAIKRWRRRKDQLSIWFQISPLLWKTPHFVMFTLPLLWTEQASNFRISNKQPHIKQNAKILELEQAVGFFSACSKYLRRNRTKKGQPWIVFSRNPPADHSPRVRHKSSPKTIVNLLHLTPTSFQFLQIHFSTSDKYN